MGYFDYEMINYLMQSFYKMAFKTLRNFFDMALISSEEKE